MFEFSASIEQKAILKFFITLLILVTFLFLFSYDFSRHIGYT